MAVNRPRSIYQYSNMATRLSGQTSIFGVVFFVSKSLLGIEGQRKLEKKKKKSRQLAKHELYTQLLAVVSLLFHAGETSCSLHG